MHLRSDARETPTHAVGDTVYSGDCAGTVVSVDAAQGVISVEWSDGQGAIAYPAGGGLFTKGFPVGMKTAYLIVGCPCSGKSWVCEQLRDVFHYVPHDAWIGGDYVREIVRQSATSTKPLLIETPFSISQIEDPLRKAGFHVTAIFIQEQQKVLEARYRIREGTAIPAGHLARQRTYAKRAAERQAVSGTSAEVLMYMRSIAPKKAWPWET